MVGGGHGHQLKCNENFPVAEGELEKGTRKGTEVPHRTVVIRDANLCPLERSR